MSVYPICLRTSSPSVLMTAPSVRTSSVFLFTSISSTAAMTSSNEAHTRRNGKVENPHSLSFASASCWEETGEEDI